jgi:hypothetical protein
MHASNIACSTSLKINVIDAVFCFSAVINVLVYCVIAQYSLVVCYHLFRGTQCLHDRSDKRCSTLKMDAVFSFEVLDLA